jgi:hypothetical protein
MSSIQHHLYSGALPGIDRVSRVQKIIFVVRQLVRMRVGNLRVMGKVLNPSKDARARALPPLSVL